MARRAIPKKIRRTPLPPSQEPEPVMPKRPKQRPRWQWAFGEIEEELAIEAAYLKAVDEWRKAHDEWSRRPKPGRPRKEAPIPEGVLPIWDDDDHEDPDGQVLGD
jgi:hypothetical protein